MLGQRLITAVIGIPVFLYLLYHGGGPLVWVTVLLSLGTALELTTVLRRVGVRLESWVFLPAAVLLPLLAGHYGAELLLLGLALVLFAASMLMVGRFSRGPAPPFETAAMTIAWTVAATLTIPVFWAYLPLLREQGLGWVFLATAITWATDSGAYFVGLALRGPRLVPRLSPKKTWSGLVGGTGAGVLAAAAVNHLFPLLSPPLILGVGLTAALVGQAGDLWMSLLKRFTGVKDTGHILPGHGGLLDRFDSFLFVLAWTYLVASLLR